MELYTILGYTLCIVGIIGCIIPMLPGPWLAYVGILLPMFWDCYVPSWQIWIGFGLCVAITILDYIIPAIGTAKFHGTKYGVWGCTIGTFLGLFFLPAGIVLGPFWGAVIGEYYNGRDWDNALRAGLGSFLGFLAGTIIKIILCIVFIYFIAIQQH